MQSRPLHTLAQEAVDGLEVTNRGIALKAEVASALRERVVLAQNAPELEWMIRSILTVASRLAERGGEAAANALVEIACGAASSLVRVASENKARRLKRASQFFGAPKLRMTIPRDIQTNRAVADRLNRSPRRA